MEPRRLITALAASMLVFFVWVAIAPRIMPPPPSPVPAATQPADQAASGMAAASRPTSQSVAVASRTPPRVGAPPSPATPIPAAPGRAAGTHRLRVDQASPRRVQLGSDDPEDASNAFKLMVMLNSRGASVEEVDLTPLLARYRNYPKGDPRADLDKDVDPFDSYDLLRPLKDDKSGATHHSFATEEINILFAGGSAPATATAGDQPQGAEDKGDWHAVNLADKHWSIQRRYEDEREKAVCTIDIEADGRKLLRVVKTYTIATAGYDVCMDLHVESLDGRPHRVILTQRGPLNVHKQDMRGDSRKVYYAIATGELIETGITERKETVSEKKDEQGNTVKLELQPVPLPGPDVEGKFLWAALGNQYFATIVTPTDAEGKADSTAIEAAQVVHLTDNTGADENGDLTFRLISRAVEVKPGKPLDLHFDMYLGPKEQTLFMDAKGHAAYVERNYMGTIQEEYYFCVWAPLAELMSNLLIGLHDWVWPHNWGLAIIILVLVVRVILHPVTKKGQVSMSRMQVKMGELQPKIEEIKKKYGNDRNKLNTETMALYKKEGINPASNLMSCLPMGLQMPIWVALWATLSNTIELRHASFMIIPGHWILDLAAPDALYRFARPVRLLLFEIDAINVLPFLWGLSMVLQQRLMPRPKSGKTSEQLQQQQRMMYIMAVVFTVMFYSFPSGLTLYIMASNFFGLLEQWRIRQHLEAEQEKPKSATPPDGGPAPKKKSKGLAASVMEKFEKFDQQQRAIKSSKKK